MTLTAPATPRRAALAAAAIVLAIGTAAAAAPGASPVRQQVHVCACNAEEAGARITEIVGTTRGPPADVVAALLTTSGRAELRHLLSPVKR